MGEIAGILQKADYGLHAEVGDLLTPTVEAIREILRRRADKYLVGRVEEYLAGDIPDYCRGEQPCLHLARHVASPNFETLSFLELSRPFGLPIVVSQDSSDKFVSHNTLKRSLGKMPVVKGISRTGRELSESFTIIDFGTAQGRRLEDVTTVFGTSLPQFHNDLLLSMHPGGFTLADDSAWIDRHYRGNLLAHYRHFLALCVLHSVMFECYFDEDGPFGENVLRPAFAFVKETFGVAPLICNLLGDRPQEQRRWYSYPNDLYSPVKSAYHAAQSTQLR